MLLNGRRLAPHPLNQTVDQAPSVLVNANVIPAGLIDRIDVLRDGA
jgi:iron complex outermembrane recepter protein